MQTMGGMLVGRVRKEQENYIPENMEVNRSQKNYAKEAILWLLSRGPQTEEDICEHFGLSPHIVSLIVRELRKAGRIQRLPGNRTLLMLRDPFKKMII